VNLITFYNSFKLTTRTYWILGGIVVLFVVSFFVPPLYSIGILLLWALVFTILVDAVVLYSRKNAVTAERNMAERFSNGDINPVTIHITNNYPFIIKCKIIDELPFQFQRASRTQQLRMKGSSQTRILYQLRPLLRGEYQFGKINLFVTSPLQLVERRFIEDGEKTIPVYPSFLQLKKYQLLAVSNRLNEAGARRLRKLGSSMEFEQIKEYVSGDDYRNVNWKATARKGDLMVNTFTDEKSQHVYCVIDKGRNMKMPFEGMTLLDYAINASLVLANVTLLKNDKAGLITFSHKPDSFLPADRKGMQMELMLQNLYRQQTDFTEPDFEALYMQIRNRIKSRSLLVLFTNFGSMQGFQRQLPYLKQIAKHHLLLVVFFENTELRELQEKPAEDLEEIYIKTIADKYAFEKRLIVKALRQQGIIALLTPPQQVTINAINKYLELKTRQAT